ncbi:hypothetical protein [Rhizobium leguminosarum]|uniref:hypothetical protein n=1 Tax=Rhizobium leguminosarum TaxID=384 RepID=UPI00103093A7|nr:hypothetical protein [Rhizobium leguminosarum]TBH55041.1 hypothetical protein ELG62_16400 [Rhizobium leguminosarum]
MKRCLKWGLVGGTLGAVVAIPLFPAWMAWVDKFQTLITGIAAVTAAYLAIRQSQITDENSDRRHDQLMELSLRPIRLKIDRTVRPMAEQIEGALPDILRWEGRLSAADGALFLADNIEEFDSLSGHWFKMVNNKQLRIGEDYFSGYMVNALSLAQEAAQRTFEEFHDIRPHLKHLSGGDVAKIHVAQKMGRLKSALITLAENLESFCFNLRELEKDYLVHVK